MTRKLFARSRCTTPSALLLCAAVFAGVCVAGLLLAMAWPAVRPFDDALIMLAIGAGCAANFGCHRTMHCGITAPLFLVGAAAAAFIEAGAWPVSMSVIWGLMVAGVAIAFFLEWRAFGRGASSHTVATRPSR